MRRTSPHPPNRQLGCRELPPAGLVRPAHSPLPHSKELAPAPGADPGPSASKAAVQRRYTTPEQKWSDWPDSHRRSLRPERSALTATLQPESGRRPRCRPARLLRVMQACSLAHSPTVKWSERRASIPRPHAPRACALPGCATFRKWLGMVVPPHRLRFDSLRSPLRGRPSVDPSPLCSVRDRHATVTPIPNGN